MSADLAGDDWCHLCGRPLISGTCPHCDRPRSWWPHRAASWVRRRRIGWFAATTVILIGVVFTAFFGSGWFHGDRSARRSTGAASAKSPSFSAPAGQPDATLAAPSTFEVLGDGMDIFGNRARLGYAFVIHTGSETSDLVTDYYMLSQAYMQGVDTVDLQSGDQIFTAKIIAVGSDCHVALLRISVARPSLPVSAATPRAGDTVTVGETASRTARHTAVMASSGPDSGTHLTFSLQISNDEDGLPVLNSAGQVVGIAEPTSLYRVDGVGYAVPILQACQAVAAC